MKYFIGVLIGFIPALILDLFVFKLPLYSFIRFVGTNIIIIFGQHPTQHPINILKWETLLAFVAISPLLFKIYKINFRKYRREILFLGAISILLLARLDR